MKFLGSTKSWITKDKLGENQPHLEISEVVLIHFNTIKNDHQHNSRVLCILIHKKSFGQSIDISPKNCIVLKTLNQNSHILNHGLLIKILNR